VFIIDESRFLRRLQKRPSNWDARQRRGWRCLPENRPWDAAEREAIILAIEPLAAIRDLIEHSSDAWLKRRAAEYCRSRRVALTADPD
jgi:hypothetical protein